MLKSINLLGVKITADSEEKVLEYVFERLKKGSKKFFITTPNPEILVYSNFHLDYRDKLNESEVALPDGIGLIFAAKLLGKPLKNRISGTDFVKKLCEKSEKNPVSIGFLGGKAGIAEKAALCLQKEYPWLDIRFVGEEWNDLAYSKWHIANGKEKKPYAMGNKPYAKIDILFVAFGHPKQEEWIYENLEKLPVKAAMGVGGAFDYISGDVTRAPLFVRKLGFEWLFRLVLQPWRWKRQLALIKFIWLVIKEKQKSK